MNLSTVRRTAAFVLLCLAGLFGLNMSSAGAGHGSFVPAIDTNSKAQVAATYQAAISSNLSLNTNWTGSASECRAGAASDSYDTATIESINWFRRMSGLDVVVEDSAASSHAQHTALMMHAQNNLSHYPTPAWRCHTETGASTAAESNLTLGIVGPAGVIGQIEDPGAGNESLGHRRWLLFPELETVGVANTTRASVVHVLGEFGDRESETNWVSWPPPGFVPDATVFDRWSLSYAGGSSVDFSNARVTVRENGRTVSSRMLPISPGFGDPTLAWEVSGINPEAAGDIVYSVDVSNIIIGGTSQNRSYSFTSFDADAPVSRSAHTCQGKPATIVGTTGADVLRGTPGDDVIVALGGNDIIDGLAGADIICAGSGADVIRAGWGNDIVLGGPGQDLMRGGRGNDVLYGQAGRDDLQGGLGADTLVGGDHIDVIIGGNGNDVCWGRNVGQVAATADRRVCERGR